MKLKASVDFVRYIYFYTDNIFKKGIPGKETVKLKQENFEWNFTGCKKIFLKPRRLLLAVNSSALKCIFLLEIYWILF